MDGFLQIYHTLEPTRCQYRQTPVCTFVELLVIMDVVPIKAKRQSKTSSNRTVDNDGTTDLDREPWTYERSHCPTTDHGSIRRSEDVPKVTSMEQLDSWPTGILGDDIIPVSGTNLMNLTMEHFHGCRTARITYKGEPDVFDVVTFVKFFNEFQNLKKNYFESSSKFGSEAN